MDLESTGKLLRFSVTMSIFNSERLPLENETAQQKGAGKTAQPTSSDNFPSPPNERPSGTNFL